MKTLFYRINTEGGNGFTLANDGRTTANITKRAKISQTRGEFKKLVRNLKKNDILSVEKL